MKKYILLVLTISMLLIGCSDIHSESKLYSVKEYTINEDGTIRCELNTDNEEIQTLYFPVNRIYRHDAETCVILTTHTGENIKGKLVSRTLYINKYEYDKYYRKTIHEEVTVLLKDKVL